MDTMSILQRLKRDSRIPPTSSPHAQMCKEAADEIERLDGLLLGAKNAWVIQTKKIEKLYQRLSNTGKN